MRTLSLVLALFASASTAQTISESGSSSLSNSGVVFGDSYAVQQAPSAVAPGNMHTAPCVIGSSFGIGVPGLGLSGGGGRLDTKCNVREEVKALNILLGQPKSLARDAALLHYCRNDDDIRATLVQIGVCQTKRQAKAQPQQVRYARPIYVARFQICRDMGGGRIGVYPDSAEAKASCRDYVRQNPGANVNLIGG